MSEDDARVAEVSFSDGAVSVSAEETSTRLQAYELPETVPLGPQRTSRSPEVAEVFRGIAKRVRKAKEEEEASRTKKKRGPLSFLGIEPHAS